MFAIEVEGLRGEELLVKTRVPRDFLNLMKGGDSPKPAKRRGQNVKFNSSSMINILLFLTVQTH